MSMRQIESKIKAIELKIYADKLLIQQDYNSLWNYVGKYVDKATLTYISSWLNFLFCYGLTKKNNRPEFLPAAIHHILQISQD